MLNIQNLKNVLNVVESNLQCFQHTGVGLLVGYLELPTAAKWQQVSMVLPEREERCWPRSEISQYGRLLRYWAYLVQVPAQCILQMNSAVPLSQSGRSGHKARLVLGLKTAAKHQLSNNVSRRGGLQCIPAPLLRVPSSTCFRIWKALVRALIEPS